jgi:hypothetical protein
MAMATSPPLAGTKITSSKAKVELWKTGKGKDPQHHVDYQTKADDGAGPDAGAVGEEYLPDGNDIRASHAPAGKRRRA